MDDIGEIVGGVTDPGWLWSASWPTGTTVLTPAEYYLKRLGYDKAAADTAVDALDSSIVGIYV